MKPFLFILLFLNFVLNCFGQNFQLQVIGNSDYENKIIDSLLYNPKHKSIKSLTEEINLVSEKLSKKGFIENQVSETVKKNDSNYIAKLNLGERIKSIHIYISRNSVVFDLVAFDKTKDTLIIPYIETEPFLNKTLISLEQKGFAMAKLKLTNIQRKKNLLYADLQFESGPQRQLNTIVVKFSDSNKKNNFPKGHLKQINRKYNNNLFNQDIVKNIYNDFEKFRFVNQIKYPEILFTKDTTKVFVYLEKRKSNNFDGFVGFTNNDNNKLVFNGYLDLTLENALKAGEQLSLNWKSDGNQQTTFKANIDIPYLFKSPIGVKAQIYIFKQDSIFQNTKTSIDLGYLLDYNTRFYLGYQATESSDIQNTNNNTISDFENSFLTTNLEYTKLDNTHSTFSKKTNLSLTLGTGKRTKNGLFETTGADKQIFININAMHNFYWNKKNCININYQNYFLKSNNYIINELYRFGGTNSIRGFAENSLQANFMTAIITEYRHIISSELFINTIMDYGYYEDKSTKTRENLVGLGFGTGIQTRNGLLKIAFSNGKTSNQKLKFENTIATISYNIKF